MKKIHSWGRLSNALHNVVPLISPQQARQQVMANPGGIAYGMGRSYGDVCLNPGEILWETSGLDKLIAFDPVQGRLQCEAGVLLRDIQRLFIPRGWTLPVTPGTQFVTVGGAIANDVHGKSHHVHASFGNHVRQLRLLRTNGELIDCSPQQAPQWFAATVGGLGLTGVILTAELQLEPVQSEWLETETIPYANLDEFFALSAESAAWEHTVSWIDCVCGGGGRGLFMRGNPSPAVDRPSPRRYTLSMPFVPPVSCVNAFTLRAFNTFYFNLNKWRAYRGLMHYQPFFYPLDNVLSWNRMYGPRGFFQYQSVVPPHVGKEAVAAMLKEISRSGAGSFLAVLKKFGDKPSLGMLSFPQPGITLALDFPNHGERTLKLLTRLDAIVREAQGRLYPAKDARMPQELFQAGYPRLSEFLAFRDEGIHSALSKRLMGA